MMNARARLPVLSPGAEQALRTVLHIARNRSRGPLTATEVARSLGEAKSGIARTLNQLTEIGVLRTPRGPEGGYELAGPPETIATGRIIDSAEDTSKLARCLLSDRLCDARRQCAVHERWSAVWARALQVLDETPISHFLDEEPA